MFEYYINFIIKVEGYIVIIFEYEDKKNGCCLNFS